ncbi:MAG TPA: PAS domain-containing protein [Nitrosomonas sp.]|nr:PAS domain-containing protein [Nitrosomonas sp.]
MDFIVEKDPGLIPQVLSKILDSCVNGVSLADPDQEDMPLVYVNKAFEIITGYTLAETVGKNCRFLQGEEHDQVGLSQLREAIKHRQPVEVTLRNYRKNGELFYNHLKMSPLFDSHGNLLYFLGVQFDVTPQVRAAEEIKSLKEQLAKLQNNG